MKRRASSPTLDVQGILWIFIDDCTNIICEYDKNERYFLLFLPFLLKYGNFSCEKHFLASLMRNSFYMQEREFFLNRKWGFRMDKISFIPLGDFMHQQNCRLKMKWMKKGSQWSHYIAYICVNTESLLN